jgi:hypothetical protein
MTRVVIRNGAEDQWQEVIESKLKVMLGSTLVQVTRIDIAMDKLLDQRTGQSKTILDPTQSFPCPHLSALGTSAWRNALLPYPFPRTH